MYQVVEQRGNEIEAKERQERFLKNEDKQRYSKIVRNLETKTDLVEMKQLRRVINLVSNSCQIRFQKDHLKNLINRIKLELKKYFGIEEENLIRANTYGLTGAGIYFVNSTLKVMIRMNSCVSKYSQLANDLCSRMAATEEKETPLIVD